MNQSPAIYISPRVISGSLQLKNNSGSVTIVADVFRENTEISSYSGWTFTWTDGSTTVTNATAGITLQNGVQGTGDGTNRTITVGAAYVPDNGSSTFNIDGQDS